MHIFLQQCQAVLDTQGGLLLSLLIGGLLGSLSHCTGMCGPIVMAQVSRHQGESTTVSSLPADILRGLSLPYHLGRTFTYVLLGVLAAGMTQYLVGTPAQRSVAAVMLLVAGALFVMKALPGLLPELGQSFGRWLRPFSNLVANFAAPFSGRANVVARFFYGVMLGFLPCGLVVAAVMAAASPGDPLTAAMGMAAFAVGTMPSLMLVGLGSGYAQKKWPVQTRKISNSVMALNGLILCVVAVRLAL